MIRDLRALAIVALIAFFAPPASAEVVSIKTHPIAIAADYVSLELPSRIGCILDDTATAAGGDRFAGFLGSCLHDDFSGQSFLAVDPISSFNITEFTPQGLTWSMAIRHHGLGEIGT